MMKYLSGISLGIAIFAAAILPAGERPAVTKPRSTSGDTAVEPDWTQKLTITVGAKDADLVGTSDKTIQAGVANVCYWVFAHFRPYLQRRPRRTCPADACRPESW